MMPTRLGCALLVLLGLPGGASASERLPGTEPLALPEDLVADHLRQVQGYFLRQIEAARSARDEAWRPHLSHAKPDARWLADRRKRLREMLGLADVRVSLRDAKCEPVGQSRDIRIERLSVPMSEGLCARGLLFTAANARRQPVAVVCADADSWPEKVSGLENGNLAPWLLGLLARGTAVYLPQSVERLTDHPYCQTTHGKDRRMILYRLGYVVGRTVPGMDVQEALAAIEHLRGQTRFDPSGIAVAGWGQGGMTALYVAALEPQVAAAVVADYFQARERCWEEPVDRRLPGQLLAFGDAELCALVAPRPLRILNSPASPATRESLLAELRRAERFYGALGQRGRLSANFLAQEEDLANQVAQTLGDALGLGAPAEQLCPEIRADAERASAVRVRNLHFEQRLRYLRGLIDASESRRQQRWAITSRAPADFPAVQAAMLDEYRRLAGTIPRAKSPPRARSERVMVAPRYTAYRVLLDVTDGVDVYGNLLVPRPLAGRAAAVICQHGLSGTPEMITGLGQTQDTPYHEFGRHLAERGFVVFAPLVVHHHPVKQVNDQARQADAVGMMRIAMVITQTERVLDFLESLPFVHRGRIGYYGLSYGGYSAIWSAPLVERLAAVVVSGHFNDWRSKITSDALPTSYLCHPDEDFYNWDILHRFTHVELVAMMAPRPVCIEFGQRDGITTPEWTAYAWRQLAQIARHLGLADRVVLAHYDGVHEVHGVESFAFLDHFLRPELPAGYDLAEAEPVRWSPEPAASQAKQLSGWQAHVLDGRPESAIEGRFWMPQGAKTLHGIALRIAREGQPEAIEVSFGSAPGKQDLGTTRLNAAEVAEGTFSLCPVRIAPRNVPQGAMVHYQVRCQVGQRGVGLYRLLGPRPLGGAAMPGRFALFYRVLTDRPQDALPAHPRQNGPK